MLIISPKEKQQILAQLPHIHIARTAKQRSNRHRYFMEEDPDAVTLLNKLRAEAQVFDYGSDAATQEA